MKKSFFILSLFFTVSMTLIGCFDPTSDIWYAATDDDVSTIEHLLDSGIDIDAKDHDGSTELYPILRTVLAST